MFGERERGGQTRREREVNFHFRMLADLHHIMGSPYAYLSSTANTDALHAYQQLSLPFRLSRTRKRDWTADTHGACHDPL